MARKPNIIQTKFLNLALPGPMHDLVSEHLYSELEQRVPVGAYSVFFQALVNEYFKHKTLDLSAYVDCSPNTWLVSGSPEAIAALQERLA